VRSRTLNIPRGLRLANKYIAMSFVVKRAGEIIDDWRAGKISMKEAYDKLVGEWDENK